MDSNIDIHVCFDNLSLKYTETMHILVKDEDQNGNFLLTIAYWIKDSEGYNLHWVADRPLSSKINPVSFMKLAEIGQKIMDYKFEEEDD